MEPTSPDIDKRDVRRPMNAFLIFCKRHRSIVREKNPDLDNRSVTRILGDLWANLKEEEKSVYTNLAKQYKDAFMKANPDYKWHNPERAGVNQKPGMGKPTNMKVLKGEVDMLPEGSIMPGKLADPSNMGGLSLLLMAGQHKHDPDISNSSATVKTAQDTLIVSENTNNSILESLKSKVTGSPINKSISFSNVVHKSEMGISDLRETGSTKDSVLAESPSKKYALSMEPVWRIDGKLVENQSKQESATAGSLEQVVESAQKDAVTGNVTDKSEVGLTTSVNKMKPVSPLQNYMLGGLINKPLLSHAMAAPKVPHKSLLTGTVLESCNKGGYSDILRDNFAGTKLTFSLDNQVKAEGVMETPKDNHPPDEKENISKVLVSENNLKDSKEEVKPDKSVLQCEKIVVHDIIDKLYNTEPSVNLSSVKDSDLVLQNAISASIGEKWDNKQSVDTVEHSGHTVDVYLDDPRRADVYDEHDGNRHRERHESDTDLHAKKETDVDHKSDDSDEFRHREGVKRIRTWSNVSKDSADTHDGEDDVEELHPVRKSRRRNRGQRYQELINEGIIQPSKERMAALQQGPAVEDCVEEEDFKTIDSYILPETIIRRIRKRTTSESAKDKMMHLDDAKRYKTGDFDLEAQIATLPACSVENMGRKRGFIRQRHNSECIYMRKSTEEHAMAPVFDVEKTLTMPPHMRLPSPEKVVGPVVGSRKRKARKHSITHLLPAPPGIFNNTAKQKVSHSEAADGSKPKSETSMDTKVAAISDRKENVESDPVKHSIIKSDTASDRTSEIETANVDKNDNTLKNNNSTPELGNGVGEENQSKATNYNLPRVALKSDSFADTKLATFNSKLSDVALKSSHHTNSDLTKMVDANRLSIISKSEPASKDSVDTEKHCTENIYKVVIDTQGKTGSQMDSTDMVPSVGNTQEPVNKDDMHAASETMTVRAESGEVVPSVSLSCRSLSGTVYEQQQDLKGSGVDSSIHV